MSVAPQPNPSRIVLVTGASDGIGRQTAETLARGGFQVIIHGRDRERTAAAAQAVRRAAPGAQVAEVLADLSVLDEVREMAEQVRAHCTRFGAKDQPPRLDVLINNAGVFLHERRTTREGVEMAMAVNHLGHFLLTHRLLPLLGESPDGRIINVSSVAHTRGRLDLADLGPRRDAPSRYDGYGAYAAAKLANVLFTYELARRLAGAGYQRVTCNALHPGVITTKLLREGFGATGGSLAEGAALSVALASAPEVRGVTGRYFSDGREQRSAPQSYDREAQRQLYEVSAQRTGIEPLPG